MKLLFVTNSVPFPARHGVELPIEKFATHLAGTHAVDLLVYGSGNDFEEFKNRKPNIPDTLRSVAFIDVHPPGRISGLLQEISLIKPRFFARVDIRLGGLDEIHGCDYDAVWVSPVGGLGVIRALELDGKRLSGKIIVGHNDAKYSSRANGFRHLIKRSIRDEWRRILNAFRTPLIFLYERRYLKHIAAVHVQTPLELERVERLFWGSIRKPVVFAAGNGVRAERLHSPLRSKPRKAPIILFMTHLSGGRARESQWFLRKVWPLVVRSRPDAELWLVGTPPADTDFFLQSLHGQVRVKGYVSDLDACLAQATVGVIPTLHSSGWMNRIADYFKAGLPLVACSEPLRTVPNLKPGHHALQADHPDDFAESILKLVNSPETACHQARAARDLINTFPTWEETVALVETQLHKVSANGV